MSEDAAQRARLTDVAVTLCLFVIGIGCFAMSFTFPGRAGVWPIFVTGVFCAFLALHLFNLWKDAKT